MVLAYNPGDAVKTPHAPLSGCTGTVLSPTAILTAAHCVTENGRKLDSNIYLGNLRHTTGFNKERAVHVKQAILHPRRTNRYPRGIDRFDVAILRLEKALPEDYVPVKLLENSQIQLRGTNALIAGYGEFGGPNDDGDFVLHRVSAKVVRTYRSSSLVDVAWRRNFGVQSGDSGGPAFYVNAQGEFYQWGVASATFENTADFQDVRPILSWICATLAF